jgi:hypothetical protein
MIAFNSGDIVLSHYPRSRSMDKRSLFRVVNWKKKEECSKFMAAVVVLDEDEEGSEDVRSRCRNYAQ